MTIECQCVGCNLDSKYRKLYESLKTTKKFAEEQIVKHVLDIYKFKGADFSNLEYYRTKLKVINYALSEAGLQ